MENCISIIGGGLAGSEATYQIAKRGIKVKLYEMKPEKYSPAHSNKNLAEIVCSNSFKSNLHTNACGLLKEELRILDSLLIKIADEVSVPAGQALAVDREVFAQKVTESLEKMENVEIVRKEIQTKQELLGLLNNGIVLICTGPLTSDALSKQISNLTGQDKLAFYDAAAPIIEKESINSQIAFFGNRYDQEKEEKSKADYLNLPMNKEEYEIFWKELVEAETANLHEFEKREIFEGCMPIEVMAKRGKDTLRFGPLKPVGFIDPRTGKRPYAVVQLRQDNAQGNLWNMVGFQTNLKFSEQKRVFSLIPGLEQANFIKYGVMHRNTYLNSPCLLNETYQMKAIPNLYFGGQITGVEGYVESVASGMVAALNAVSQIRKEPKVIFPEITMIGALAKYITTPNANFQPMNANFGILPELPEKIKDKKLKYGKLADRSIEWFKNVTII